MLYFTLSFLWDYLTSLERYLLFDLICSFISPQTPHLGGPGLINCGLSEEECLLVQRFDPAKLYNANTDQSTAYNLDTIGFFIAKFVKKCC